MLFLKNPIVISLIAGIITFLVINIKYNLNNSEDLDFNKKLSNSSLYSLYAILISFLSIKLYSNMDVILGLKKVNENTIINNNNINNTKNNQIENNQIINKQIENNNNNSNDIDDCEDLDYNKGEPDF